MMCVNSSRLYTPLGLTQIGSWLWGRVFSFQSYTCLKCDTIRLSSQNLILVVAPTICNGQTLSEDLAPFYEVLEEIFRKVSRGLRVVTYSTPGSKARRQYSTSDHGEGKTLHCPYKDIKNKFIPTSVQGREVRSPNDQSIVIPGYNLPQLLHP